MCKQCQAVSEVQEVEVCPEPQGYHISHQRQADE